MTKKTKSKKEKCVDKGAKPNWHSPHKKVGSSWKGDKLMTTKYVGETKAQKKRMESPDDNEWRGINYGNVNRLGAQLGIALPRLPKYVEDFNKRNGFSNPKQFTRT